MGGGKAGEGGDRRDGPGKAARFETGGPETPETARFETGGGDSGKAARFGTGAPETARFETDRADSEKTARFRTDAPPPAQLRVQPARSGPPTAFWNGRPLHSRFDPVREAENAAAAVPPDADIVILAGFALGYVAEALLRRSPRRPLIIAEAVPEIIEQAAAVRGISAILDHPRVSLTVGGDPENVRALLTKALPAVGSSICFLPWKPSIDTAPGWYGQLEHCVDEHTRRLAVNARTLERFGPLWIRNLAANAELIAHALSVGDWEGHFHNLPGLVLAGGPSLEEVIPHLPELARRHLIVAVDTALAALRRAGVVPDIVAAVDPQYWNTRHLDYPGDLASGIIILAESATHPAVFRKLKGRPCLTRSRFPMGTLLEDAGGIRGELKAGGSVATAAWELIRHLGCSPMTAAGLDLGFPAGRTHYSGSLARELPHYSSNRTGGAEAFLFNYLRGAGAYRCTAASGEPLLTDRRMDVYHAWFVESAAALGDRSPQVVGMQGRPIPGMPPAAVDTLLRRPVCRESLDERMKRIHRAPEDPSAPSRVEQAVKTLKDALENLEELAVRGRKAAEEAIEASRRGGNFQRPAADMDAVDRQLLRGSGLDVVSFLIQPVILELNRGRDTPGGDPLHNSKRLYSEIADSAAYHRRRLLKKCN